jgi:hypothetical protein
MHHHGGGEQLRAAANYRERLHVAHFASISRGTPCFERALERSSRDAAPPPTHRRPPTPRAWAYPHMVLGPRRRRALQQAARHTPASSQLTFTSARRTRQSCATSRRARLPGRGQATRSRTTMTTTPAAPASCRSRRPWSCPCPCPAASRVVAACAVASGGQLERARARARGRARGRGRQPEAQWTPHAPPRTPNTQGTRRGCGACRRGTPNRRPPRRCPQLRPRPGPRPRPRPALRSSGLGLGCIRRCLRRPSCCWRP